MLHRELMGQGFGGSPVIVHRFVRPLRVAATRSVATVRYETAPGQQAQVDFGQRRVWVGTALVTAHVFIFNNPPHFHARYGGHEVTVELASGLVTGSMPRRALGLVFEWSERHRPALEQNWQRARDRRPLLPIPPLD